ncbi:MAG: PepSY domain-containing protein [Pyrinomonadaceae bacterium]|nr:PepSY domain-containing protein [Pyrinomonadaceae bacterium]
MKRNKLVGFCFVAVLAFVGTTFGMDAVSPFASFVSTSVKITADEARKIALKRVEGKVVDEYTLEDDEGEIESFVYIIKRKDDKKFEVQIDATDGKVVSVEEYSEEDEEDSEDPPVS